MAKQSIAEELVKQLADFGVKTIFGITGDALNAFTDAIRRDKRIQWITVRHEETAAFAAAAQAELSGELAVCAGTVGPGALHLINGLYNAKRDRSPVLAITGQVARDEAGSDYFQEVNQQKAFDDVCVFTQTLASADQMPRVLHMAIEAALSKRGVAHIAVPTDIAITDVPVRKCSKLVPSQVTLTPPDDQLQLAAKIINETKKVGLLIGCGARGAADQVLMLAKTLKAPIVHALKGSEVISFNHAYSIGGVGHVGTPHGLKVLDKSDLLLMIGTDFPYSEFLPEHGNIIQIDCDATHLGRRCHIKLGLHGHVDSTINQLLPFIKEKTPTDFLNDLQKERDKWNKKAEEKLSLNNMKGAIRPQSIVLKLSELADDDAIFVGEVGEVTVWVARHLRMRGNQRLIGSFNHGSLGVGLPAAIGAKALYPKRQVIALCGDGAFGMLMADFVTAARYNLNLVTIVFDNNKFGFVELEMEASGLPRFATDLVNPDFAKVAEACSGIGISVEKPDELESALKQALKSDKPVLVNVKVNPNELIIPPKIDPSTAWRFMQGKIKEVLLERFD